MVDSGKFDGKGDENRNFELAHIVCSNVSFVAQSDTETGFSARRNRDLRRIKIAEKSIGCLFM